MFGETFHGNFICSQSFCQKSAERKSPKKYFLYFVLMFGLGLEPIYYLIDYSDLYNNKYKILQRILKCKIEGRRGRDKRKTSWLKNIQEWTGYSVKKK